MEKNMTRQNSKSSEQPFAAKKFLKVHGHQMAYIDEGEGAPIIFQHGTPTSSYLWRNVMSHLKRQGRLIAADFMGMGDSEKLDPALGASRYRFEEQRKYLQGLWDALELGDEVILVLHDVGSMVGFDWANQHRDRVQGIAYMESIVMPLQVTDFPEAIQDLLRKRRRNSWKRVCTDWTSSTPFFWGRATSPRPSRPITASPSSIPERIAGL
jgi:haloalkane dehalogenase